MARSEAIRDEYQNSSRASRSCEPLEFMALTMSLGQRLIKTYQVRLRVALADREWRDRMKGGQVALSR